VIPSRLVLFDVDGTLLSARGAGRRALRVALEAVYGTAGAVDAYDLGGQTDLRIVLDLMTGAGLPLARVRAGLDDCFERYARALGEELERTGGAIALPGVAELVPRLAADGRVVLGLVTGNIEEGARLKLAGPRLGPYFRTGAFGSDDADRTRLPSLAARRVHALLGHAFAPDDVVVVGDTPRDVECGRAFGARTVAVATGRHPRAALLAVGADAVLDSFEDVPRALHALGVG
jgi:phosphoglycolate phosphatase-like HAD superfamily hydrolase